MDSRNIVLLVGCPELARAVVGAGYEVEVVEYFWGCSDPVLPIFQAAIVRTNVGGGTGLSVAERLVDYGVVPLVLYGPGERCRVEPRFFGAQCRRGEVPAELVRMLGECVRMSNAIRIDAPTTEIRTSMIVRADSTSS